MSAYTDQLNRRQNMTAEERRADILRDVFGVQFRNIFPELAPQPIESDVETEMAG